MESITKNRQSLATLRTMIERAYGADLVPLDEDFAHELGHGWFNVAYRLRLRDGRLVVMKIAPPADVAVMTYETDMMSNELAAVALVTERTSVRVPQIDFEDTTRDLCDAYWFVMPFIEGENFGILAEEGALTDSTAAELNEQLGAVNRELNTIVGPFFGPLAGPPAESWRAMFLDMIEGVLRDGEQVQMDLGFDYATFRRIIAENADTLDAVTEPRFVEWDLWSSNVMVRDGRIVAILDHERAFWGDPLMEAGFVGLDIPLFGDPVAFMRGYGKEALSPTEQRRRLLYTLYLVLIMAIETRFRGHQDTRQYDVARSQLAELVERFEHLSPAELPRTH